VAIFSVMTTTVPAPRTADAPPFDGPIPVPRPRPAAEMHRAGTPRSTPVRRPAAADVAAVQGSLAAVRQRPVQLAEAFYAQLFEMAPGARAMFPRDLTVQMEKMTAALLGAVTALSEAYATGHDGQLTALERSLRRLGAVHRDRWQVQDEHYRYIPHALTRAVRDVAGAAWSGRLSSSWIGLVVWINGHMLAGAADTDLDGR
jgi:hemoglobin-like flavoprotein